MMFCRIVDSGVLSACENLSLVEGRTRPFSEMEN
jgi:hypothetical protein